MHSPKWRPLCKSDSTLDFTEPVTFTLVGKGFRENHALAGYLGGKWLKVAERQPRQKTDIDQQTSLELTVCHCHQVSTK